MLHCVYESDPDKAPDSDFVPGLLRLIRVGNEGRMLDPRRTPVTVVGIHAQIGMFELEVSAFEDKGARWRLPLEDVGKFQFAHGSPEAGASEIEVFEQAVVRFDKSVTIEADPAVAVVTRARLEDESRRASAWLRESSEFFATGRALPIDSGDGDPLLFSDLARYLDTHGVADLEREVAETYVSNPHSGEVLKGHRIVLAEMGLVGYRGKIVRDPDTFTGRWAKNNRERHIVARLGFVRAMLGMAGLERIVLYRSLSFEGQPRGRNDATFVSSTFSRRLAESWLDTDEQRYTVVMTRQPVAVERVFMTFLETAAMNSRFREAEAVLLADEATQQF
jgi:hypothetical protein